MSGKKKDPKERLMAFVGVVPETGCWMFGGCVSNAGYGLFNPFGKNVSAHRASWTLFRGEIPSDRHVLHTCDVKLCVNPDHLYLGTPSQNAQDAIERGQKETGDRHWRRRNPDRQRGNDAPHRTLNEDQVKEIRASKDTQTSLAARYGVTQASISQIILRKSWKHLLGAEHAGQ